ncbi:hypothetical protein GF324_10345 [bacterium]|nr:hypothetical protein [bacterium]
MSREPQRNTPLLHRTEETPRPILTIWTRPRRTFRYILLADPNWGVMIIGVMAGIAAALRSSVLHGMHPMPDLMGLHPLLDDIIHYGIGPSAGWVLTAVSVFVYGSTVGVLFVVFGSAWMYILVRAGGARVHYVDVRAVFSWSFAPYTVMLPLWAAFGNLEFDLLRAMSFNYYGTGALGELPWEILLLYILDLVLRAYSFVILFFGIRELTLHSIRTAILLLLPVYFPPVLLLLRGRGFIL